MPANIRALPALLLHIIYQGASGVGYCLAFGTTDSCRRRKAPLQEIDCPI